MIKNIAPGLAPPHNKKTLLRAGLLWNNFNSRGKIFNRIDWMPFCWLVFFGYSLVSYRYWIKKQKLTDIGLIGFHGFGKTGSFQWIRIFD